MVVGLDGLERVLIALDPVTLKEDTFRCTGYKNLGTFAKGNLVDCYQPPGKYSSPRYTLEDLKKTASANNYQIQVYMKTGVL